MRPFTDTLRDMRKGRVVDAATEQLAEVVRAVLENSKPGSLTLTLKVEPQGKGDNAVVLSAKIATKVPQPKLPDALFFADLDGDLFRDDPTQREMFSTTTLGDVVDKRTGEVVAEKAGA